MTYPAFGCVVGSRLIPRDGRTQIIMGDGVGRVAKEHADMADFQLIHVLSADEAATFEAFYAANATADFDFVWPSGGGETYRVRFAPDAKSYEPMAFGRRRYTVKLIAAA